MRLFLLCALTLAVSCGRPSDALVGTYTVLGIENATTINGQTMTQNLTVPASTKLVVTHDTLTTNTDLLVFSLGGSEIATVFLASDGWQTVARSDTSSDADCDYRTNWASGGTVVVDGTILTMKRSGSSSATCRVAPDVVGTVSQTAQFSKDR